MKILLIGASGTIGSAIAAALSHHEIIAASRRGPHSANITDPASIEALFRSIGTVDAVIAAAGGAAYKPLAELTTADFEMSFGYKLMGQINLTRIATPYVADGGSITLTGGLWGREPVPNTTAIATVNSALEGFVRGAALEMPRGIRINLVAPPLVGAPEWHNGRVQRMSAEDTAKAYVDALQSAASGRIIDTPPYATR